MASESSGNDFEGVLQNDKGCISQFWTVWLNESDIDGSDRTGGSGEVAEDSETDSVSDNKSDTDKVYSYFDGDIVIEWRNSPSYSIILPS